MKKTLLFVLAAMPAISAVASPCATGEVTAVVRVDTVGAINLERFREIDFKSTDSMTQAVNSHVARAIAGGSVACRKANSFFDYASLVSLPGQPIDLWVEDRALEKAD
ncbi:hypothetical protein GR157_16880 [Burkholderia sp. 4701]|nr:hypothetical protein [Burkholderia sp. 4701]MXN83511.1 hypothetical protein [Burkholderia sp. 4812]